MGISVRQPEHIQIENVYLAVNTAARLQMPRFQRQGHSR